MARKLALLACLPVCLYICMSFRPSACLSVRLSVCLSVCLQDDLFLPVAICLAGQVSPPGQPGCLCTGCMPVHSNVLLSVYPLIYSSCLSYVQARVCCFNLHLSVHSWAPNNAAGSLSQHYVPSATQQHGALSESDGPRLPGLLP